MTHELRSSRLAARLIGAIEVNQDLPPLSSFRNEINMKVQTTVFLCSLILMISPAASGQGWRKITPIRSTRADVERLLGPNNKSSYGVTYDLKDGILSIEYSSGPCRKERKGGWNVPEGVVVSFSFSPKKKQRERDLKLNRKKFRRVVDSHTGRHIYYINDRDGIMYQTQQGLLDTIENFPPKRYDHLHCGDPANENNIPRPRKGRLIVRVGLRPTNRGSNVGNFCA